MQTQFDALALTEPDIRQADAILRRCVHCGFCTATCPTYQLTGDELDGPRGRIKLIKNLLENPGSRVSRDVNTHLDRCLGCLSCTTTCPADVAYGDLLDIARARLVNRQASFTPSRLLKRLLIALMIRPRLFRMLLHLGSLGDRLAPMLPSGLRATTRLARHALQMPRRSEPLVTPESSRGRVILLAGCVQQAAGQHINASATRILQRAGFEVVQHRQARCCGALPQHLGEVEHTRTLVRENLQAWRQTIETGCKAILVAATGCSGIIADYETLVGDNPELAATAKRAADKAVDIGAFLAKLDLPWREVTNPPADFAWHAPCSLQHDLRGEEAVLTLLRRAGFKMRPPVNAHLCCGAAGTYSILQHNMAEQLGRNKAESLVSAADGPVVSANLGCMLQLAQYSDRPVVHYLELLDWASGGERPIALENP